MTIRIVLSGCSGGGKSTLLAEMTRRGYQTFPEPGRQIVQEGLADPIADGARFAEFAIDRSLASYTAATEPIAFFDRSLLDAVIWFERTGTELPARFKDVVSRFRYHQIMFLVPPWPEIFREDAQRKHGFDVAVEEYDALLDRLPGKGYETKIVPRLGVRDRADWIMGILREEAVV